MGFCYAPHVGQGDKLCSLYTPEEQSMYCALYIRGFILWFYPAPLRPGCLLLQCMLKRFASSSLYAQAAVHVVALVNVALCPGCLLATVHVFSTPHCSECYTLCLVRLHPQIIPIIQATVHVGYLVVSSTCGVHCSLLWTTIFVVNYIIHATARYGLPSLLVGTPMLNH